MNDSVRKIPIPFERSLYFLHPYNACLVTCRGKDDKANIMTVAWMIPVSVDPPLVAMSIRPERYSNDIIMETREFIVNIPTFDLAQKVLFCGRRSGRDHDKFKETGLSPQSATKVNAPIIKECVAHLECRVVKAVEIGDHTLIVGQIVAAHASDECFGQVYDMEKFRPCLHVGKNFFTTCVKRRTEPVI